MLLNPRLIDTTVDVRRIVASAPTGFSPSFSEPVSPLALRLIKPDGSAVALDKFVLRDKVLEIEAPSGLMNGTHVISWRVVSEDGHPVGGSVIFSVGAPSTAPPQVADAIDWQVRATLWVAKVGLYVGLVFGIGGVFGLHWFIRASQPGRSAIQAVLVLGVLATVAPAGLQGNPTAGIEPIKRVASKGADGRWRAENVLLPLAGKWTIRVDILISDFELAKISGEIELRN